MSDHGCTIATTKVIDGNTGQLVQRRDPFSQRRYWYGACNECGLCSKEYDNADRGFDWLRTHLTDHPQSGGFEATGSTL